MVSPGRRRHQLASKLELHHAADHLEALFLHRVHVRAGHLAVRVHVKFDGHELTAGVGRGLAEDEPLATDRVLENLPGERHFRSLLRLLACWLTCLTLASWLLHVVAPG